MRRPRPHMRRGMLALLATVSLLAACDARPVLQGHLSAQGSSAEAARVSVQAFATGSEVLVAEVRTGADGHYVFRADELPAGSYKLRFNDDVWYGGTDWASAQPVAVDPDSPSTIDSEIVLRLGSVAGDVATTDGQGVAGVSVELLLRQPGGSDLLVQSTTTGAGGAYEFVDVPAGPYLVRAEHPTLVGTRPMFVLAPDQDLSGVSLELGPGGGISGSVTDRGSPMNEFGSAILLDVDTGAVIGMDGPDFSFQRLEPGEYRLGIAEGDDNPGIYLYGQGPDEPGGVGLQVVHGQSIDLGVLVARGRDCNPLTMYPGSDHDGKDLRGLDLRNCDLAEASMLGVDLSGSVIEGVDFTGANLAGAELSDLNLADTSFRDALLMEANLERSHWDAFDGGLAPDFRGASMQRANLTDLIGVGARLDGANMSEANLTRFEFAEVVGVPHGGSTATYLDTLCSDWVRVTSPATCVGRGINP